MRTWSRFWLAAWTAGALLTLSGCGGGGTSTDGDSLSDGRVQVGITDQSGGYAAVVLSIREVRVVPHGSENGGTAGLPLVVSFSPSRVVDVAQLQFQQQILGSALVGVGTYSQLRLVLDANPATGDPVNYVIRTGSTEKVALRTPSGQESGLKINGQFAVVAGQTTALVLDFDPERAIVEAGNSGNLNLKPTSIRLVQTSADLTTYGAISGQVSPAAVYSTAVVYVIPVGSTTPIAAGYVDPDDGTFRILVPPGNYYLQIVAGGYATYDSSLLVTPVEYNALVGVELGSGVVILVAL